MWQTGIPWGQLFRSLWITIFKHAYPWVFVAIVIMIIFAFLDVKDCLLSFSTLVVSFLILMAGMRLFGKQWNLLNLTAIPLLLGTLMDYSIHTIYYLRRSHGDIRSFYREVGKALLFCGGSTAIGFGSLTLASHPGLASMGGVCAGRPHRVGCELPLLAFLVGGPEQKKNAMKPEKRQITRRKL